jgi:hypothetical protein
MGSRLEQGASLTGNYPHLYRYLLASPALMNPKAPQAMIEKKL